MTRSLIQPVSNLRVLGAIPLTCQPSLIFVSPMKS